jgi:hypothetical protein
MGGLLLFYKFCIFVIAMSSFALHRNSSNPLEEISILTENWLFFCLSIAKKVKAYFGFIGLLLLIILTSPILLILFLLSKYRINNLAKEMPQIIKQSEAFNYKEVSWKDFKKLEYRIELLHSIFKELPELPTDKKPPKFMPDFITNMLTIKDSITILRHNVKSAYQFKVEKNEAMNSWNEYDDIWDYDTPEEDKEMMFESKKDLHAQNKN